MKLARVVAHKLWRPSSICRSKACHNLIFFKPISNPSGVSKVESLYKRISPIGDPNVSIVPILDQWVKEGNTVEEEQLRSIVKEYRHYRRYRHALEISEWMCNKRYIPPSQADVAQHLSLIYKVYGLQLAEEYFCNTPKALKGYIVYAALLECYVREKSVEKAEALMEEIRDMGTPRMPAIFNSMMNLYYQTGNYGKLDDVMHEMEVRGIPSDSYAYGIRLSAYADASDVQGIDKIVAMVHADAANMDYGFFAVAAGGYLKVGQADKAVKMLRNLEGMLEKARKRNNAFDFLIRYYSQIGMKDEVYRVWNLYKAKEQIYNTGYRGMIGSLLKLDDFEGANRIFEEWESARLSGDIRIPNMLVNAFSKKGLLEEAEIIIKKALARGVKLSASTWFYLATGYLKRDDIEQAVEAIKKAICIPSGKLRKETLISCLEYLEVNRVKDGPKNLIRLIEEDVFSAHGHKKLLNLIENAKQQPPKCGQDEGDA
ncbi:Pentatricopeptide repeat [Dillenia turbinata]|uniref:Pentatricopeptide repeat n=1 Tax=Dillenia turbinata TaxID=194707 RepID=A0AAN8VFK0_9MAGN